MKKLIYFTCVLFPLLGTSCKKEPGSGGTSTIYGKVHVHDYDPTFTQLQDEYDAPDADVYIIYGDNEHTYNDRIKTNPNGFYEFGYLKPGEYRIYVYSKDSTLQSPSGIIPVERTIEITERNETVEVPEILIYK